jgi:peptidoglycan/xylan/chitin deacetylase (PgdA/CDA1 family)
MPPRRSTSLPTNLFALGAAVLIALTASAEILRSRSVNATASTATPIRRTIKPTKPPAPSPDAPLSDGVRPNELGRIPILMYHSVGDPPLTGKLAPLNRLGLSISAALFRKHLEMLYRAGFYPVNLRDILRPGMDVPRGRMPVVLTFDDARKSQFRYRWNGVIDPNCAVGVLSAFHATHRDWPERATFFVLPQSQYNPIPFGQRGLEKRKCVYLVAHGYELANHSTSHHPMSHMNAKQLTWEMATCARYFQRLVPRAPMNTMALPYGIPPAPALLPVLLGGPKAGFENRCITLAVGVPSYAPADKRFNRLGVMRVGSDPGNIEKWIQRLAWARRSKSAVALRPYVSDGNPAVLSAPASQAKYLAWPLLRAIHVAVYADNVARPVAAKPHPAARKG